MNDLACEQTERASNLTHTDRHSDSKCDYNLYHRVLYEGKSPGNMALNLVSSHRMLLATADDNRRFGSGAVVLATRYRRSMLRECIRRRSRSEILAYAMQHSLPASEIGSFPIKTS